MSRHWLDELAKVDAKPEKRENKFNLPDVENGVRLFVRLKDVKMMDSYKSPVTEVVPDDGEWKLLEHGERTIDAAKLSRWLKLVYPPGVNEQLHPYDTVSGTLTLKPVDDTTAILSGRVTLSQNDNRDHPFTGTLEAVVTYDKGISLRGVVDGLYPRKDPKRGWSDWKLNAAIESRP